MTPKTIGDLRAAGYMAALASGSVAVEETALEEARARAGEIAVTKDAEQVANEVANLAVAKGVRGDELVEFVGRVTKHALEQIQEARDDRVAFQERALEIARSSPDVFFVSALGDPETPDDDIRLYVACKLDGTGWDEANQEMLDALCDSPQE